MDGHDSTDRPAFVPEEFPVRFLPVAIAVCLFATALAFAEGHDYPGIAGLLVLSVLSLTYGALRGLP